jgi:hypothetical protein
MVTLRAHMAVTTILGGLTRNRAVTAVSWAPNP